MMTHRRGEVFAEPLTLVLAQCRHVFEARVSLLSQGRDVLPPIKELLFSLTHYFDEDFALTPTATAKAAHDFAEMVLESFCLLMETCVTATALLGDAGDEF
jgi:hypothetical protein